MNWLYRFTRNPNYPDPVEEIDALCTLDDSGERAFLLLGDRNAPPMSGAACGDLVGLCTDNNGRLVLHGTGVVADDCVRGAIPASVQPLYGFLTDRCFSPLRDLVRVPSADLPATTLSLADQQAFLNGQSYVKRLTGGAGTTRPSVSRSPGTPPGSTTPTTFTFSGVTLPPSAPEFTVVGLDPTAGTWSSKMAEGPDKAMPSFKLRWDGKSFFPHADPLKWHTKNVDFWNTVQSCEAVLTCIDGPCGTNGPRLLPDRSAWDRGGRSGVTRGGELALSREGVNLYWTTQNTVLNFDGASRWIARSIVLFGESPAPTKIETHPHGAFTFLWRLFGSTVALPKKGKPAGRQARLSLLRSFIPGLTDDMVPNHDALDAACAALVAGLHQLNLTKPFGTAHNGGQIWMPDSTKLASHMPASGATAHV